MHDTKLPVKLNVYRNLEAFEVPWSVPACAGIMTVVQLWMLFPIFLAPIHYSRFVGNITRKHSGGFSHL